MAAASGSSWTKSGLWLRWVGANSLALAGAVVGAVHGVALVKLAGNPHINPEMQMG